jgi:CO/xanthine dehydrogenase FAD-binding subunit
MKPPAFEYHAPETLAEALALMAEHGWDAKPLAGGQSLVPAMNFRLASPAVLIDLNRITDLDGISASDDTLHIRAMTRQNTVERSPVVAAMAPLLHEAMPWIAHPQIRSRGTIGGSVAHADPAAELPAVMVALEARLHAAGPEGERTIPANEFFLGLLMTALAPDELLTGVEIPALPPRTGVAFLEFARRHGDYALVGVAALLGLDTANRCVEARVTLLSVGEGPFVAATCAAALVGSDLSEATLDAAAAAAAGEIDPTGDMHATADFRRHLTRVLVGRALRTARARAQENCR